MLTSAGIDDINDLYADTTDLASNRRNTYQILNDYNSLNTTSNFLCKMTLQTYETNPMEYLYDSQFGDFRLIENDLDDFNVLIYRSIEPLVGNITRYVIAGRGSQSMYDYLVDIDILRDYSSDTNGIENYMHLYSRLLEDVYNRVVQLINSNAGETGQIEYYLTGHSLAGKIMMDVFNMLITNNKNTGVYCYLYNPYTIHDVYAEDLLNNIDLALLGQSEHLKYFALRTDLYAYITQGDYISALYLNFYPGNVFLYPSISSVQNYLPNLLNMAYSAIISNNNHSLSNFTNKTDADVELTMLAEYYFDEYSSTLVPIDLSIGRIVNHRSTDLSSIAGTLSNDAHLHLKAVSDTQQFMNLIVLETDDDHTKYLWEYQQQEGLYKTYFIQNEKKITPVYKIINHEYTNNYHYIYLRRDIHDSTLYNIIKLNSTGNISNTSQCVFTEKIFTPIELSNKRATGIDLQFTSLSELQTITQPDAIIRRQFTLTFGESSLVVPIQEEATWHDADDLRRVIKYDLFTHDSITDTDGITFRFSNMTTGAGGIDVYEVHFYLYDTGNGIFKWGHVNVGDINNYKVILEHTSDNYYTVKSNSYMQSSSITNAADSWEILYYDTNRYMIRSTNPMGSTLYLKKPTYDDWNQLQVNTIHMQIENTSSHFMDMVWDSWDGIAGNPGDYLFNIEHYSDISLKPISDSLTNNVNGIATDTFMLYPNYLRSPDGDKILTMEYNGNLIIWHKGVGSPWHANSYNDGNGLVIQSDGNCVVYGGGTQYDKNHPGRWSSSTSISDLNTSTGIRTIRITNTPVFEILDDNGNVVATYS